MSLELDIRKNFGQFSLNLALSAGTERLGLLGSSGSGKSMTLRCIAGIEKPDQGRIVINGRTVFDSEKGINLRPQVRKTGYLFQHYALVPTMTLEANLALVLQDTKKPERTRLIGETLERLHLSAQAKQRPSQLSGGQQQRAALARVLVSRPDILLLDEPFSALDFHLRSQVEQELMESLEGFGGTIVFVSHNRDEIYRICQSMVVLEHGKVQVAGPTAELFSQPRTLGAARLTGCKNIARATKIGPKRVHVEEWGLELDCATPIPEGMSHVGIRAHHIRPAHAGEEVNCFEFVVERVALEPFTTTEYLTPQASPGQEHRLRRDFYPLGQEANTPAPQEGGLVRLCLPAESIIMLEE